MLKQNSNKIEAIPPTILDRRIQRQTARIILDFARTPPINFVLKVMSCCLLHLDSLVCSNDQKTASPAGSDILLQHLQQLCHFQEKFFSPNKHLSRIEVQTNFTFPALSVQTLSNLSCLQLSMFEVPPVSEKLRLQRIQVHSIFIDWHTFPRQGKCGKKLSWICSSLSSLHKLLKNEKQNETTKMESQVGRSHCFWVGAILIRESIGPRQVHVRVAGHGEG